MRRPHRVCIPGPSCLHSAFSCLRSVFSCLRSAPHLESRLNRGFQKGKTPSTFLLPYFYHHKPVDKTAEGKGHPEGVPPRLSARLPLPGKRSRCARVFAQPRFFLGSSVFCTQVRVLPCCMVPSCGRFRATPCKGPLRSNPHPFGARLRLRSACGFRVGPCSTSRFPMAPGQHRPAPGVQIKAKPIWYGKKKGASRFLRQYIF